MAQLAPMSAARCLLALVVLGFHQASAEIFNCDQVPVPGPHTLQTHYMFYVQFDQGVPGSSTVAFKNLVVKPSPESKTTDAALKAYKSLQVSIMPINDFLHNIDTQKFCSDVLDVNSHLAHDQDTLLFKEKSPANVVVHTITGSITSSDEPVKLSASGTYVLVFSNCGPLDGLSVSGTVEVQNPWGFLPAIEYHRKALYGFLSLFYAFTAIVWSLMALRWWTQLLYIQKGIVVLNLVCVIESIAWYVLYTMWNNSGDYTMVIFLVAGLAACWKMIVAFRVILMSSANEEEDRDEKMSSSFKVHLILMLYMVLDFNMKTVMTFRNSRALNLTFILENSLPAILMGMAMFVWIHVYLSSLIQKLRERGNDDKAPFFQKVQGVMGLAALAAGGSVALQVFDPTVGNESLWGYHFLAADGFGQVAFALILSLAMAVAMPTETLQGYEYSVQAQTEGGNVIGAPGSVWDDDDCEAEIGNKVAPGGIE